jgi:hypothetical protein
MNHIFYSSQGVAFSKFVQEIEVKVSLVLVRTESEKPRVVYGAFFGYLYAGYDGF